MIVIVVNSSLKYCNANTGSEVGNYSSKFTCLYFETYLLAEGDIDLLIVVTSGWQSSIENIISSSKKLSMITYGIRVSFYFIATISIR